MDSTKTLPISFSAFLGQLPLAPWDTATLIDLVNQFPGQTEALTLRNLRYLTSLGFFHDAKRVGRGYAFELVHLLRILVLPYFSAYRVPRAAEAILALSMNELTEKLTKQPAAPAPVPGLPSLSPKTHLVFKRSLQFWVVEDSRVVAVSDHGNRVIGVLSAEDAQILELTETSIYPLDQEYVSGTLYLDGKRISSMALDGPDSGQIRFASNFLLCNREHWTSVLGAARGENNLVLPGFRGCACGSPRDNEVKQWLTEAGHRYVAYVVLAAGVYNTSILDTDGYGVLLCLSHEHPSPLIDQLSLYHAQAAQEPLQLEVGRYGIERMFSGPRAYAPDGAQPLPDCQLNQPTVLVRSHSCNTRAGLVTDPASILSEFHLPPGSHLGSSSNPELGSDLFFDLRYARLQGLQLLQHRTDYFEVLRHKMLIPLDLWLSPSLLDGMRTQAACTT